MVGLMLWVEFGLEGCHGGFVCVCVCVCFAWWFDWQWWIGMWVCCVCFLLGGFVGGGDGGGFFFVSYGMGGRFVVVVVWVVSFW